MKVIRKSRHTLAAVAAAGALLLTGFAQPAAAQGALQARAHEAAHPSSITVGVGQTGNAISTLDPSQWAAQLFLDQGVVMEGLYGYSPTGKIVPKIATHHTVSDGGRVWTFYLRHNAKWSNGQPVTAQDFYYSWMRTLSPKNSSDAVWASVANYVNNGYAYHDGGVPASQVGIKVINNWEIQLTLSAPHNIMGEMVITGSMPLYPPSVEAHPSNWFEPQYFVSDGPYTIKSFVPNGEITLVRNPDYVGASGEKNVGNIKTIHIIPNPTVDVEDYLSNKLSAAVILTPSDYKYALTHLKSQLHSAPDNQLVYLEWDKSTNASPLDNLKVRQAIAMALERKPIVDHILNGMAGVTDTFGFKGWPSNNLQKPLPENVAKAKKLLKEAGYPNGKGMPTVYLYAEVTSSGPTIVPVAEGVQAELKQNLGIKAKIIPEASTLYGYIVWNGLTAGIHPGYVIGQGTPNWTDSTSLPIQSNQELLFDGTIGPSSYRQHVSNYYFPKYDPEDVAQLGNPASPTSGTTQAEWNKLNTVAESDITYLKNWTNKQPATYKKLLTLPGAVSNAQQWANYTKAWEQAKTAAAKHSAFVSAWEFVGDWSAGESGANIGLNGQVWVDQHQPKTQYEATMWNTELTGAISTKSQDRLTADLDNLMLQQGYGEPLYYVKTFYLEKPGLTGLEVNPWSWGGLFQFQYATWK